MDGSRRRALIVYVVWHPDDHDAGHLASRLLRSLHADPDSQWAERLGIPVKFRTSLDHYSLPLPINLDDSDASVTVVLWGDGLGADRGDVWRTWVHSSVAAHGKPDGPHRTVNATLTATGLGDVGTWDNRNTTRLHQFDSARQFHELLLAVLRTCALALDQDQVKVFISHAKVDAELAMELKTVINEGRMKTFFDAHDIQDGTSSFTEITDTLDNSAIVALFSDVYPTREWCRLELLHSREHGRPVVLVDVLDRGGVRVLPYLDHIPIIRPGTYKMTKFDVVLEYLLREVVRHRYFERQLEKTFDDAGVNGLERPRWLWHTPDALSMLELTVNADHVGAQTADAAPTFEPPAQTRKRTVVYPDPPLGPREREILVRLHPGLEVLSATEWRSRT